jgi:hypothetical protein
MTNFSRYENVLPIPIWIKNKPQDMKLTTLICAHVLRLNLSPPISPPHKHLFKYFTFKEKTLNVLLFSQVLRGLEHGIKPNNKS